MPQKELVGRVPQLQPLFEAAKKQFQEAGALPVFTSDKEEYKGLKVINVDGDLFVINEDKCIGQGTFGVVYVAQDEQGDCFAFKAEAITKINRALATREHTERVARKNREPVKAPVEIAVLDKTGKYKAYAIVKTKTPLSFKGKDGKLKNGTEFNFSVSTLEKGDELGNAIEKGPLDLTVAYQHALKAAFDLYFLHSLGIVHADIKLQNYMTNVEDVNLNSGDANQFSGKQIGTTSIDYGLSIILKPGETGKTFENPLSFTMGYMAPEIINLEGENNGASTYSFASDVYALGVVFMGDGRKDNPSRVLQPKSPIVKNLGLPSEIFADMCDPDPGKRLSLLEVIEKLVRELRQRPDLDDAALQMIYMYENFLKTKGQLGGAERYKDFQIHFILTTFVEENKKVATENNGLILAIINNPNLNNDQKMVALKGYLLQHDKESNLLQTINKASGKARFIADQECENFYNELAKRIKVTEDLKARSALMRNFVEDSRKTINALNLPKEHLFMINKVLNNPKYDDKTKCIAIRGFLLNEIEDGTITLKNQNKVITLLRAVSVQFPSMKNRDFMNFYSNLPEMNGADNSLQKAHDLFRKIGKKIKLEKFRLKSEGFLLGPELTVKNHPFIKERLRLLQDLLKEVGSLGVVQKNDQRVNQLASLVIKLENAKNLQALTGIEQDFKTYQSNNTILSNPTTHKKHDNTL